MAVSLQLEAPGGHKLKGLLMCSGAGRAYWELLVAQDRDVIPGRNEPAPDRHRETQESSEAGSCSPWSCFRRGWSQGSSCLLQTTPAPSRLSCQELWVLDSGVTTGVWEGMGLVSGILKWG